MARETVFLVLTKTSQVGLEVFRTPTGAYSVMGKWGAGSGPSSEFANVKKRILSELSRRRGYRVVIESDFWKGL